MGNGYRAPEIGKWKVETKPVAQPRHQGFSLKKWAPPIFQGKSPGDEVARGLVSSSFITHSLFCSYSSFSCFQCSVPVTRLSVKSLSDGHLWDGSLPLCFRHPNWILLSNGKHPRFCASWSPLRFPFFYFCQCDESHTLCTWKRISM